MHSRTHLYPSLNTHTHPHPHALRDLHPGEVFRATITATVPEQKAGSTDTNPSVQGFSVPIVFDSSKLTYLRSELSPLWSSPFVPVVLPSGAPNATLVVSCLTRTGSDNM